MTRHYDSESEEEHYDEEYEEEIVDEEEEQEEEEEEEEEEVEVEEEEEEEEVEEEEEEVEEEEEEEEEEEVEEEEEEEEEEVEEEEVEEEDEEEEADDAEEAEESESDAESLEEEEDDDFEYDLEIFADTVPPPPSGWAVNHNDKVPLADHFKLSNCTGKKRALFVGCNYPGSSAPLTGCINDVTNIRTFLMKQYNFKEEDCLTLTDDQTDPELQPTRLNMLSAMKWLVHDAQPNDSFFFHFSGHGGQELDTNGEEDDGIDENICPVDYIEAGTINDDILHQILVASLPAGCRLTVVLDCCHSGSALDLPYTYSSTGAMNSDEIFNDMSSGVNETRAALLRGDVEAVLRNLDLMDRRLENKDNREYALQIKSSEADCIMLSGCKDSQTSADTYQEGFGRTGALSWSLITTLSQNPKQSYLELLNNVRDLLKEKYSQKPQLSSSHPVDLNRRFTM